jgi:hypothetical protein
MQIVKVDFVKVETKNDGDDYTFILQARCK